MRQVTEVASQQEGPQISQQQPVMLSVAVYSLSDLTAAEFQIHPGNPSVVIPAGQAAGIWSRTADGQNPAVHWES